MHDLGLREYLQVLSRRKWIVLQAVIIVPLAAVAFSLRQPALYQSSADVLLRYQTLPSTLSGISDPNSYSYFIDPVRAMDTSLQVASLPLISDRVSAALKRRGIPTEDVSSTGAVEVGDTDVIEFVSSSGSPGAATAIATEYARQFALYYQELDSSSIKQAIAGLQQRIDTLVAEGRPGRAALQSKIDQLETLLTLQTSTAVVVRRAAGAAKVRPTPRKYGILGLGLGLVLGIGLALLRDAFDTRLRTPAQIGALLKLPLLSRVPEPPRRLARDYKLVMVEDSTSVGADAFRRLRMNLEFASIGKPSQVMMFTSALSKEGKSTTIANLGVALALAGKNVAIVDLDLHRPTQRRFFGLGSDQLGITSVVLGYSSLDDALVSIDFDRSLNEMGRAEGTASRPISNGSLVVLPTGPLPPDPGEFVVADGVNRIIAALRERVDVILVDAPPLLAIGDGLTIAGFVDALVVMVRSEITRRPITAELANALGRLPATKLGYVLAGDAGLEGGSAYGYGRYTYERAEDTEEALR